MRPSLNTALFRKLPSVDEVLREKSVSAIAQNFPLPALTDATRAVLERLRSEIASGWLDENGLDLALAGIAGALEEELRRAMRYSLRPVINATGVILHTNLGRAPLAGAAFDHMREIAAGYSNLEFDIDAGERGKRDVHADRLFHRLLDGAMTPGTTPGPSELSTIVVNNNAAAVLLALNTLAEGGEVIVSRGELVEIGGSFRIPDVMKKSGAILREVGTTNRTRIADYESAINERTRSLLRVHRSNFAITGFTEQASMPELVRLARAHRLPVMEDQGSGALVDLQSFGISGEPSVPGSLHLGIDIVTYSGDKLLGGPQAGLISGRADLVAKMRANSLFRALRIDKLTYAALEATLLAYVRRDHDAIPALGMMRLTQEQIGRRAENLASLLAALDLRVEVIDGESLIGGGTTPSSTLPTRLLAVSRDGLSADELAARWRACDPPVIARVEQGRVLLDLRTVFPEQDQPIAAALKRIGW